jgi:hypothetical protein
MIRHCNSISCDIKVPLHILSIPWMNTKMMLSPLSLLYWNFFNYTNTYLTSCCSRLYVVRSLFHSSVFQCCKKFRLLCIVNYDSAAIWDALNAGSALNKWKQVASACLWPARSPSRYTWQSSGRPWFPTLSDGHDYHADISLRHIVNSIQLAI